MHKRRFFMPLAATTALMLAASGCSTAGTSAGSDDGKVTVTVFDAYAGEEPHGKYISEYADAFMAANPDIKIEVTTIASNDIFAKLAAMATDPSSIPTLYFTSGDQAPSLYSMGFTQDLNSIIDENTKNTFAPGVAEGATLDSAMAFYPVAVQPLGMLYRTDRFADAGIETPTTWEEFLPAAKKLTTSDGDQPISGFGMIGSNNSSGQSRFLSYLWSNCLSVVEEDASGTWTTDVDSKEFLDALTYWTNLNEPEHVVPDGITSVDYPTAANYFSMGYTSTMMTGGNALGVAYAANPELKGKIGSFPIPGACPGSQLNAEGYAMSANASDEQKEAALKYLDFFVSNDTDLNFWQSSGKIPATTEGQAAEYLQGDDYAGLLETINKGTVPVINFPGMAAVKTALGNAYASVFSGEATNEEAAKKLKADIDQILSENN